MATPLFGPYGSAKPDIAAKLEASGANAVWFHGFNEESFETCAQYGIAACVELKTFRADFDARPDLIPIGIDGSPIRYGRLVQGVCLSKRDFLDEIEAYLLQGLETFRPAGIWLDYLTYSGWFEMPDPDLQESCFCAACIAEFCEDTGVDADQPAQILAQHQAAWTRHKCERVAGYGRRYADLIRGHLPECIIGAYMCPWTPDEFDGALTRIFAQDYESLAPAIDVFTPLIYCVKSGRSAGWGREFLEGASAFIPADRKVQLIMDVLDFPASLQCAAEAAAPSWGIQLFGGAEVFRDPERAAVFRDAAARIRDHF